MPRYFSTNNGRIFTHGQQQEKNILLGVLGMRLMKKMDFPEMKFSLYFLGYVNESDIPSDEKERTRWCFSQKATLEVGLIFCLDYNLEEIFQLTHNWGTEAEPGPSPYHNGNSEPRGFGHIGIMVPDVDKACQRFEEQGVEFVKKPNDGKMKGKMK